MAAFAEIDFEQNRSTILARINNRTKIENMQITVRRIISFVINLGILVGGIFLIIKVQDREKDVIGYAKSKLEDYKWTSLIPFVNFFPSLIISVLNFTLPTLTKIMVDFE